MKQKLIFFFLTCLSIKISLAHKVSDSSKLLKGTVGIYVKSLNMNEEQGTFYADFYWWIRLPYDSSLVRVDPDSLYNYYNNTVSQIEFMNAIELTSEVINETKIIKDSSQKSFFYKTGNLKGTFNYVPDFKKYPIDQQILQIVFESPLLTKEQLSLVPEINNDSVNNFLDHLVDIKSHDIIRVETKNTLTEYETDFGDQSMGKAQYSRLTYGIVVKRSYLSFILKILIPNILLLVIAYLVFFIPSRELEVAVGCTVTSLLSSIALKLTIDSGLPKVGYTTYADQMFYLFYFLITSALVQTVFTYNLSKKGNIELENKLERMGRILYPVLLILGLFFILN